MSGPRSPTREANNAVRDKRAAVLLVYLLTHGATPMAKLVADLATTLGGERMLKAAQKYLLTREWIDGEPTAHPHNKAWKLTESGQAETIARKAQREAEKAKRTA